jgi:hypothetical protein
MAVGEPDPEGGHTSAMVAGKANPGEWTTLYSILWYECTVDAVVVVETFVLILWYEPPTTYLRYLWTYGPLKPIGDLVVLLLVEYGNLKLA